MQLKQILTASLAIGAATAQAQGYPTKTVRIVVPFVAGGNTDFTGRTISAKLTEALGQQFIVDNRPGGYTNIGADMVVRSARAVEQGDPQRREHGGGPERGCHALRPEQRGKQRDQQEARADAGQEQAPERLLGRLFAED